MSTLPIELLNVVNNERLMLIEYELDWLCIYKNVYVNMFTSLVVYNPHIVYLQYSIYAKLFMESTNVTTCKKSYESNTIKCFYNENVYNELSVFKLITIVGSGANSTT